MTTKLSTPSIHHLTLKALEKLDLDRHYADPDLPIEDELDIALVQTATKDDTAQTITLVFIDGVQEELTYREILGRDYFAYTWGNANLPLPI